MTAPRNRKFPRKGAGKVKTSPTARLTPSAQPGAFGCPSPSSKLLSRFPKRQPEDRSRVSSVTQSMNGKREDRLPVFEQAELILFGPDCSIKNRSVGQAYLPCARLGFGRIETASHDVSPQVIHRKKELSDVRRKRDLPSANPIESARDRRHSRSQEQTSSPELCGRLEREALDPYAEK